MSCDCLKRIEEELTAKMVEVNPGFEVLDRVEFQNKGFLISDNVMSLVVVNPVLGRCKKGRVARRFVTRVMPTYCPFCGKILKQSNGKEEGK